MWKSKWIAVALALSTGLASGLTLADPSDRGWDRDHQVNRDWNHRVDQGWNHQADREWAHRVDRERAWERNDRPAPAYYHDRRWDYSPHYWGAHPVRYWHEGDYIPRGYMDDRYYVDWHERRLPPPPRGHRWMQIDGDFVLVAVASSVITQILLGSHFR